MPRRRSQAAALQDPTPQSPAPLGRQSILDALFGWALPVRCVSCGDPSGSVVCASCARKIIPITTPFCSRCGAAMPPGAVITTECRACRDLHQQYDAARAMYVYGGPLRLLVLGYKFRRKTNFGAILASLMEQRLDDCSQEISAAFAGADSIVPVPMHPIRMIIRGYNQAEMLAEVASRKLGLPIRKILWRPRFTRQQVRTSAEQRHSNLKDAFRVKPRAQVTGRTIILIDDVMTTGATAHECAVTLKRAGAKSVMVLVLARGRLGNASKRHRRS